MLMLMLMLLMLTMGDRRGRGRCCRCSHHGRRGRGPHTATLAEETQEFIPLREMTSKENQRGQGIPQGGRGDGTGQRGNDAQFPRRQRDDQRDQPNEQGPQQMLIPTDRYGIRNA